MSTKKVHNKSQINTNLFVGFDRHFVTSTHIIIYLYIALYLQAFEIA